MNTHKEEQAPIEWLLDDLLTTILDSSPKELVGLHNKLEALAESIQERKSELAPLEPRETPHSESINEGHPNRYGADPFKEEWVEVEPNIIRPASFEGGIPMGTLDCTMDEGTDIYREPTPPSQIEEEVKSSFEQGYELGLEHGRELALKDLELLNLEKQLEAINKLTKE